MQNCAVKIISLFILVSIHKEKETQYYWLAEHFVDLSLFHLFTQDRLWKRLTNICFTLILCFFKGVDYFWSPRGPVHWALTWWQLVVLLSLMRAGILVTIYSPYLEFTDLAKWKPSSSTDSLPRYVCWHFQASSYLCILPSVVPELQC